MRPRTAPQKWGQDNRGEVGVALGGGVAYPAVVADKGAFEAFAEGVGRAQKEKRWRVSKGFFFSMGRKSWIFFLPLIIAVAVAGDGDLLAAVQKLDSSREESPPKVKQGKASLSLFSHQKLTEK